MKKIAVVVGSLRKESINLRLAKAVSQLGASKFEFKFCDLSDLPLYNEDLWANPPTSVTRLKSEIRDADAVLFVTPEYNRSLPAVTKNVIDWASRPMGESAWPKKPVAILGASPGSVGTAVAQSQFRGIAGAIDVRLLCQPEVYFTFKAEAFNDQNDIVDEKTKKFLEKFLSAFETFLK